MPEAVIVATARSPIGRARKGSLRQMRPDDLLAQMIDATLGRVPQLDRRSIDDIVAGCAQPAGESGFNLARVAGVLLGMDSVPGTTVNRYCSSSLQSTRMAYHAIKADEGDVFISAGVETVSRYALAGSADSSPGAKNPFFEKAQQRFSDRKASGEAWLDPRVAGEVPDVYMAMGNTAENVAGLMSVSRQAQDEFAVRSQNLAEAAIDNGFWDRDITPVNLPDGTTVTTDDGPRIGTTLEDLARLSPAFAEDGTVTAGNCCGLNDGAASLVVMSDSKAADLGITPLARIVSTGVSALTPEIMGLGPVEASRRALARAGMSMADIDLVEMNEAFAAQVIPSAHELNIGIDKLNVNGGAIAIGHPFGMTGARITTTLINSLQFHDKQFGLETMCVGGGQGMAMVLERLS